MCETHVTFLQTQGDIGYQTVHQQWVVLEITKYVTKGKHQN